MAKPITANFDTFTAQDTIPPQVFTINKTVGGTPATDPLNGATAILTIRDGSGALFAENTIGSGLTVDGAFQTLTLSQFTAPSTQGTYKYDLEVTFPEPEIGRQTMFAGSIPIIDGVTKDPNT